MLLCIRVVFPQTSCCLSSHISSVHVHKTSYMYFYAVFEKVYTCQSLFDFPQGKPRLEIYVYSNRSLQSNRNTVATTYERGWGVHMHCLKQWICAGSVHEHTILCDVMSMLCWLHQFSYLRQLGFISPQKVHVYYYYYAK